jgi:hypothetical protein
VASRILSASTRDEIHCCATIVYFDKIIWFAFVRYSNCYAPIERSKTTNCVRRDTQHNIGTLGGRGDRDKK